METIIHIRFAQGFGHVLISPEEKWAGQ